MARPAAFRSKISRRCASNTTDVVQRVSIPRILARSMATRSSIRIGVFNASARAMASASPRPTGAPRRKASDLVLSRPERACTTNHFPDASSRPCDSGRRSPRPTASSQADGGTTTRVYSLRNRSRSPDRAKCRRGVVSETIIRGVPTHGDPAPSPRAHSRRGSDAAGRIRASRRG